MESEVQVLIRLAERFQDLDQLDEAEGLYRRAIAELECSHGVDYDGLAPHLESLASLLWKGDRREEARRLVDRALGLRSWEESE